MSMGAETRAVLVFHGNASVKGDPWTTVPGSCNSGAGRGPGATHLSYEEHGGMGGIPLDSYLRHEERCSEPFDPSLAAGYERGGTGNCSARHRLSYVLEQSAAHLRLAFDGEEGGGGVDEEREWSASGSRLQRGRRTAMHGDQAHIYITVKKG